MSQDASAPQQDGWESAAATNASTVFSLTCIKKDGQLADIPALFRHDENLETISNVDSKDFVDLTKVWVKDVKYLGTVESHSTQAEIPSYRWRRFILSRGSRPISFRNEPSHFGQSVPMKFKVDLGRCPLCCTGFDLSTRRTVRMLCCEQIVHLHCYDKWLGPDPHCTCGSVLGIDLQGEH